MYNIYIIRSLSVTLFLKILKFEFVLRESGIAFYKFALALGYSLPKVLLSSLP